MRTVEVYPGKTQECQYDWPEDVKIQAGDRGVVFGRDGSSRRTAFFEAFPRGDFATFMRGEGDNVAEAEEACWKRYETWRDCPHGEYERRDYINGSGFCIHCGTWFSHYVTGFAELPDDPDRERTLLERLFLDNDDDALVHVIKTVLKED